MLRRTYDKIMALSRHHNANHVLAVVSFLESSVFPIPVDLFLFPMVLAERAKAWFLASLATITSVFGGLAGYAIGYLLFDTLGKPILGFYGYGDKFSDFAARYNDYGAWIVFFAGVTPFPYKVITIASGVTALSLPVFIIASILARGLRFFAVCGLLYWFGEPIRALIEKYLGLATTLLFTLLIGGFIVAKYLL